MKEKEFFIKNKGISFLYKGVKCILCGYCGERLLLSPVAYRDQYEQEWIDSFVCIDQLKSIYSGFGGTGKHLIFSKQEELSEINPLNLCSILSGHEGETFYSTICGICEIFSVDNSCIVIRDGNNDAYSLYSNGKYNTSGECTLFPSKENRDWSTYKPKRVLPEN